ncbi:hypothetical protein D4764_02G0012020 [Takifugu flavidus]|uniref:Uncharacterized protein n=1 Tax=Takifugu flavidus TaxID=433684 RepID=A0A5C6NNC0_9TELE|nr:hypothetical protein D4764_02G0012020 [Takifugu flavidus]
MRRLEEVSLQPVRPPASQPPLEVNDPIGLPSYEEAIAKSGQHDAPPPPYPGYCTPKKVESKNKDVCYQQGRNKELRRSIFG